MTSSESRHDGFGMAVPQPLSRIQQIVGRRLHEAWTQIPHVTHHEDADLNAVDEHRKRLASTGGSGPSPLAYVVRACAHALRQFPKFCASLDPDGKTLWLKQYVHCGIAVDSPHGLLVPVLQNVDTLSVDGVARAIQDLAARGRAGALKPTEMEGSCFTISSLGGLGGTGFTPIINAPNVAILGLAQARLRPACIDGEIRPRLLLPMSLSYDHRVIDGADSARFCACIRDLLMNPAALDAA